MDHTTAFLAPMLAALLGPLISLAGNRLQRATASWLLKPTDPLIAAAVLLALGAFVIAQAKGGGVLASFLFSRI
jgi:hypothetical protein